MYASSVIFDADDPFLKNVFFLFYWICSHIFIHLLVVIIHVLLKAWPQPAWMFCLMSGRWRKSAAVLAFYRVCVAPPPAAYKSCQKAAPIGSRSHLFLLLLAFLTTQSELSWYLLICIVPLNAVVSFLDIYRLVLSVYLLLLFAVKQATSKDIIDS